MNEVDELRKAIDTLVEERNRLLPIVEWINDRLLQVQGFFKR